MSRIVALIFTAIIMIVVIGLVLSLPVMWLWNYCLVPATTGLNEIGWLQAWGILVLSGLLFKTQASTKE